MSELTKAIGPVIQASLRNAAIAMAVEIAEQLEVRAERNIANPDARAAYLDGADIARFYADKMLGATGD